MKKTKKTDFHPLQQGTIDAVFRDCNGYYSKRPQAAQRVLLRHWKSVLSAACFLARNGNEKEIHAIASGTTWLVDVLFAQNSSSNEATRFIHNTARASVNKFMSVVKSRNSPLWLMQTLRLEFEIPWMMCNGKPAPGFKDATERFLFGACLKKGKSRFDTTQTRAVAASIREVWKQRMYNANKTGKPISREPIKWNEVKPLIHKRFDLEADCTLGETMLHASDAEVKNEWMKRCKKTFTYLNPKQLDSLFLPLDTQ